MEQVADRNCWTATTEWCSNTGSTVSGWVSDSLFPTLEKIADSVVDFFKWIANVAEENPEACIIGSVTIAVGAAVTLVIGYVKGWFGSNVADQANNANNGGNNPSITEEHKGEQIVAANSSKPQETEKPSTITTAAGSSKKQIEQPITPDTNGGENKSQLVTQESGEKPPSSSPSSKKKPEPKKFSDESISSKNSHIAPQMAVNASSAATAAAGGGK